MLPPTINTNGAAGGCKDFCLWCQEASCARRGWVNDNRSVPPHRLHALRFRGRLEEVFDKVALYNQYDLRWISGVILSKRPWVRRIPWSGLLVKLR